MPVSRSELPDQTLPLAAWNSGRSIFGPLSIYARAHASQLIRFVLIGAGLAVLNLSFLYCLRNLLHLSDPIAVTAMYMLGALMHFPAHRWITYAAQDQPIRPQGLRYAVMLAWNFAIMQIIVALASRVSVSPYLAVMASTGCTMIFNFLVMTHIVFAKVAPQPVRGRPGVAASTELPREVVDILRLRGVSGGAVLLLAECPLRSRRDRAAPQFQLTRGAIDEAPALANRGDFAAVVLILGGSRAGELESTLAAITPLLAPGSLLVILIPPAAHPKRADAADDRESAHLSLLRSGYDRAWMHSHRKTLCISAKRAPTARAIRTCSILVPVFNEKDTFPELMRMLLAKRLDHLGLAREIILIESNSTDGTRELVAGFAATPGVRIIWQDRPRGKGHAVRAGLGVATGDIVMIQDADLEYDLNDYEALLEPLLADRAAFVLGSRHGGRFRMRRFPDQRLLGEVLNIAHVLLAGLINVLYGQNMKDPFTMFKVFRRDCLYGLQFECNGFDFDHELVIKLVLKGYRPLEIPVNYRARSFNQGKKIRFFRDPPALIAADLKYRMQRLRPRFE